MQIKDEDDIGPAKIEGFEPELTEKVLKRVGRNWYASDDALGNLISEEVETPEKFVEGTSKKISVNSYERNFEARHKCLKHHGYKCAVCNFDFEKFYGSIGKNYIHVHHIVPLSEIKKAYILNPIEDLIPVCPNCHAMIHRTRPALSVVQLRKHLEVIIK
jgi:5-methylcytosine-specific restriction protein A